MNDLSRYGDTDEVTEKLESDVQEFIDKLLPEISKQMKKASEDLYTHVNETVLDYLTYDTKSNFTDEVRLRANRIIENMLNGHESLVQQFALDYNTEKFREEMYKKHQNEIHNKLIDDLTKERDMWKESYNFARGNY